MDQTPRNEPDVRDETSERQLVHLSDMSDFEIADGEPDIKGWDVRTSDGRKIGEVDDLLVDERLMKVRYIEVKVESEISENHELRDYLLVPIGAARLHENDDDVIVNLESTQVQRLPRHQRRDLSREYEESLLTGFGRSSDFTSAAGDFYTGDHFHEHRLFEGRRRTTADDVSDDPSYLRRTVG